METTPFDMRSSLNPNGGLALLEKDSCNLSRQAVQPSRESRFADMLGKKISQTTPSGAAPNPTTAAPGGKPLLPAATAVNGDGEPATGGKTKRTANHHPLSSARNNEPLNGIAAETTSEMVNRAPASETEKSPDEEAPMPIQFQPVMVSSPREDAPLSVAGPAGKKSFPLTEKADPPKEAKTAIPLAKKVTEQALTIPTMDSAPARNPMAATPADSATPASHEVRPLSGRHADYRSPLEADEHQMEPAFMQQAAETLQQENDRPATDGAPAKDTMAAAPADPAAPASHEIRPLSGRHADYRFPLEADKHQTESAFMQRAAETPQQKNDRPATDGIPAKDTMAAAPADPAAPASHEVRPLSGRHADYRSPLEADEHRTELAFMRRAAEAPQQKNDGPATDGTLLDIRETNPSRHDHWKRVGESKEGASIAAAPQKPISAVGDGDAAIGQAAPERMTPGGVPDKTLTIRDTVTETPGLARDHQQSRDIASNYQRKLSEHDMFPFRMEMPTAVSPQETHAPATLGSTGIEMQAVIDQILEARRGVSNDFGRIRILLNPPNLGTVDLDIVVRRERVEVVMTAENATVQQALQSRGDDIRIALQRQDLKIEGFQVLLQDNGTSQQQTNSGEMYRQSREHREKFNASEDTPPAFPVSSPVVGVKSAVGRVSIFA